MNGDKGACSRRRNAFSGAQRKPLRQRGRSHRNEHVAERHRAAAGPAHATVSAEWGGALRPQKSRRSRGARGEPGALGAASHSRIRGAAQVVHAQPLSPSWEATHAVRVNGGSRFPGQPGVRSQAATGMTMECPTPYRRADWPRRRPLQSRYRAIATCCNGGIRVIAAGGAAPVAPGQAGYALSPARMAPSIVPSTSSAPGKNHSVGSYTPSLYL